jgi:hypothetical protein
VLVKRTDLFTGWRWGVPNCCFSVEDMRAYLLWQCSAQPTLLCVRVCVAAGLLCSVRAQACLLSRIRITLAAVAQVGMGMGEWSEDKVKTDYNLVNPPLRDTTTGKH